MVDTLLSNGYCVKVFDINKTSINNGVDYYTGDINSKEVRLGNLILHKYIYYYYYYYY